MSDVIPFPLTPAGTPDALFEADFRPVAGRCVVAAIRDIPKSAGAEVIREIAFRDSAGELGPLSRAAVFAEAPRGLQRFEEAVAVAALPAWLRTMCRTSEDLGALADVSDECARDEAGRPCLVETEHDCPCCGTSFREQAHLPVPQPCPDCGAPVAVLASLYIGPEADLIAQLCSSFMGPACTPLR